MAVLGTTHCEAEAEMIRSSAVPAGMSSKAAMATMYWMEVPTTITCLVAKASTCTGAVGTLPALVGKAAGDVTASPPSSVNSIVDASAVAVSRS